MGLRFQFGDPEAQAETEAMIERLLVEHLGPLHAERLLRRPIDEPVIE
jgi:hypothetical protein